MCQGQDDKHYGLRHLRLHPTNFLTCAHPFSSHSLTSTVGPLLAENRRGEKERKR